MSLRCDARIDRPTQRRNKRLISKRRMIRAALFIYLAVWPWAGPVNGAEEPKSTGSSRSSATIPFEVRRGRVMVPTHLNGTNKVSLLLDTGYSMTMLREEEVTALDLKRSGRSVTIVGIAGEEQANVYEGPEFGFDSLTWRPRRVGAFPAERSSRSRRRDGVLGSGFFRRFVVEIDSVRKQLVLHEPQSFGPMGDGEVLALSFKGTTPIVEATVKLAGGNDVRASFEIDTGCDGALCIGKHFVEAHGLAMASGTDGGRVGVGGRTPVREGHLPRLRLGSFSIERPTASFFLEGSPVDAPLAGHIGWELLKDFHVVFDYSRKQMILKRAR
jgi:Aspartyl protease